MVAAPAARRPCLQIQLPGPLPGPKLQLALGRHRCAAAGFRPGMIGTLQTTSRTPVQQETMPRYYFDIRDGDHLVRDDEGLEIVTVDAAWGRRLSHWPI